MATFVLVPGAWLGGWCWQELTPRLRDAGHQVYTPTLTGLGERRHLGGPQVDLDTHLQDIVNVLEFEDLHDVTLVGHSYGGFVVTGVASRAPERVRQVIYLDASVPEDGQSLFGGAPPVFKSMVEESARTEGEGWGWVLPPWEVLSTFVSINGIDDEHLGWFRAKGTPHPVGTLGQPIRFSDATWKTVGRAYISCTAERTAESARAMHARTSPDWGYGELATGHWPMFSMPTQTAELLTELAEAGPRPA